jgi:hypothetical protein
MDVRNVYLGITRRADRPHRLTLGHAVVGRYCDRAQMEQRDGVAIRCPDRDRASVPRQPAGEGDASARRCTHG